VLNQPDSFNPECYIIMKPSKNCISMVMRQRLVNGDQQNHQTARVRCVSDSLRRGPSGFSEAHVVMRSEDGFDAKTLMNRPISHIIDWNLKVNCTKISSCGQHAATSASIWPAGLAGTS